jgi:hypothetical protein
VRKMELDRIKGLFAVKTLSKLQLSLGETHDQQNQEVLN